VQGTYEGLGTRSKLDLVTSPAGDFHVDSPQEASYTFSARPGGGCRDAVTNALLRFPFSLNLPAVNTTTVNAIALLTMPAAGDPAVAKAHDAGRAAGGHAPAYLWRRAYRLVGYDPDELGVRAGGAGRGRVRARVSLQASRRQACGLLISSESRSTLLYMALFPGQSTCPLPMIPRPAAPTHGRLTF
jgi:hypothetical protein